MDIKLFDFDLPEENIALRPAVPRDASRLLVVNSDNTLEDRNFGDLIEYLREQIQAQQTMRVEKSEVREPTDNSKSPTEKQKRGRRPVFMDV